MGVILFIEDEIDLGNVIKQYLELNNFQIEWKTNGQEAKDYIHQHLNDIDLAIIDVSLPELNGFELAQYINGISEMPYLFLTARKEKTDKITGLKLGAVDYITKPFDIDELIVRIENILKRNNRVHASETKENFSNTELTWKDGRFVKDQLLLKIGTEEHTLTLREAELLEFLFKNKNKLLKREVILTELWGKNDYFLGRSLDVFISRLRKFFAASENIQIANVYGIGYIFKTND